MLTQEEVEEIRAVFDKMHREGVPGRYEPANPDFLREVKNPEDPLYKWPRVMHPHRFNERARHYLLHPRVAAILKAILGQDAVATQTMFFFKPPGARGQAMHQDQFYLLVEPGKCMGAWTAIDDVDNNNGGMWIVPKTDRLDLICD